MIFGRTGHVVIGAAVLVMSILAMHSSLSDQPHHGAGADGQVAATHHANGAHDSARSVVPAPADCAGDACGHPLEHVMAGCVMALLVLGATRLLEIFRSGAAWPRFPPASEPSMASGVGRVRRDADPPDIHLLSVIRC